MTGSAWGNNCYLGLIALKPRCCLGALSLLFVIAKPFTAEVIPAKPLLVILSESEESSN